MYVPLTVIFEFEWVMRGFYKLDCAYILQLYRVLLSFTHVEAEDHAHVVKVLNYYEQGLDFADSLHAVVRSIIRRLSPLILNLPRLRKVLMGCGVGLGSISEIMVIVAQPANRLLDIPIVNGNFGAWLISVDHIT